MGSEASGQGGLDQDNASFWDFICGSRLAQDVGATGHDAKSLERFDDAYMCMYPFLQKYLQDLDLRGRRVLEIGLGYGTVGQAIASMGAKYHGLDIASAPVALMNARLANVTSATQGQVVQGSALKIPYPAGHFDVVVSIGCLHHTGDLQRAIDEVYRVLRPGGTALVMLYHSKSFKRRFIVPVRFAIDRLGSRRYPDYETALRMQYDSDTKGDAAPHVDTVDRAEAKQLFRRFSEIHVQQRNFSDFRVRLMGRSVSIARRMILATLGRMSGHDLYILARK